MKKGTVLTIDDDANLQTVIKDYLESDGYKVTAASDLKTGLDKAEIGDLDIVLLDLMLPDGEGLSLIPQVKNKSGAGIIVVSGKSDTTEKIICLEMGADDYLTKPFEMRELSARIKALLRRKEPAGNDAGATDTKDKPDKIKFDGGWCLDRSQYQLYNNANESADLTTGEFKLLEALLMTPNRVLSREQLFDLTRDGHFDAYDRAIDIQIARLRKKLKDDKTGPELIKTVRGAGYMFCGKVDKS